MTDHPRAFGDPLPDVDQLDFVGVDNVDIGVFGRQRRHRDATAFRLGKVGGKLFARRNAQHSRESHRRCDRGERRPVRAILVLSAAPWGKRSADRKGGVSSARTGQFYNVF
ncbi:hypothetical protein MAIC_05730 [Mycolicibacterium aichiense]|uniref:Uncharacterized protein n=1 Tax=Mycolicibacterium aichiense TaxID=1799 RepID=A0AAD1HHZ1_9MYCO|nr:hypothetical protein MAIC_05730 [Mycolicibacterium aichiense]